MKALKLQNPLPLTNEKLRNRLVSINCKSTWLKWLKEVHSSSQHIAKQQTAQSHHNYVVYSLDAQIWQ